MAIISCLYSLAGFLRRYFNVSNALEACMQNRDIVIVDACRTAIGTFGGSLVLA